MLNERYSNMIDTVNKMLEEQNAPFRCELGQMHKDNVDLTSVVLRDDENLCPTLYMEDLEDEMEPSKLIRLFMDVYVNRPKIDISNMDNVDYILENVRPVLLNSKLNKEAAIKQRLVYDEWLDFIIIYSVRMSSNMWYKVNYNLLSDNLEIAHKLHERAIANHSNSGIKVLPLSKLLTNYIEEPIDPDIPMILVTNNEMYHGASLILDGDLMAKLFIEYGTFYILPSSVHEVILVPIYYADSDNVASNIASIVKEINDTVLSADQFLSNSIYIYDGVGVKILLKGEDYEVFYSI